MFLKIKKNNQGTALILTILIAGVLFTLSSFLISQVLINTKIVEKATSDEENYSLAKAGIFYAIERLNNWPGESPDYDSTDWPSKNDRSWHEYDIDQSPEHSGKDVRIRVDKDDLPHDAFSLSSDDSDTGYITIESQDIKKKVTLQAVAEYKSPLTQYVRLIGSDTTFGDNTFGPSGSSAMIQGNAPFCVLGNLTWEDTSSNDLTLTGDSKAIIYGVSSFDETKTNLTINSSPPDFGYHYYTDPDNPRLFDIAGGHYFDQTHLPSCYDHNSPPNLHYGGLKSIIWPRINEAYYSNLAGGSGSDYYIPGTPSDESGTWTTPDTTDPKWSKDSLITSSCTYTGTGTLIILDGNGQTSGIRGQVGIDDGKGGEQLMMG